jgi:hypothetical protein
MKKTCLAALLFFVFACVSAQSGMVKGYLISSKGDTLQGEIKVNPKKEIDLYTKVTFRDANGAQKVYRAGKAKAYGFNDRHFVSITFEEEPGFYEVLAQGEINFYKLGFEELRMNQAVFEVEYYLSKSGENELVLLKESKFKKQMGEWMKDNTEFIETYGEDKKFNYEKALGVIKNYNAWKANK